MRWCTPGGAERRDGENAAVGREETVGQGSEDVDSDRPRGSNAERMKESAQSGRKWSWGCRPVEQGGRKGSADNWEGGPCRGSGNLEEMGYKKLALAMGPPPEALKEWRPMSEQGDNPCM
jgi:hypothetical protein